MGQGEQERQVLARGRAQRQVQGQGGDVRGREEGAATTRCRRQVKRLRANTKYWFRFTGKGGKRSDVGTFKTAPKPKQNATIKFAWSGDQDFNPEPGKTTPYWNNGEVLARMKAERNHFNVMLGDTIYSDSEVPGRLQPIALSVKQKWAKYRINLGNKNLQALRRSAGFYSHWDDHEFVNDFSPAENEFDNAVNVNGRTLYNRGQQAFRDYSPVSWSKRNGIYRTVRWGRNLEVFFLDQRSFRSANADANHVCDNPDTGSPDRCADRAADHAQPVRARDPVAGTAGVPGLPRHDPQPEPHLPGQAAAATRFLKDVKSSTARFKVIMNELPIQQYYVLPYDRWEGFEAERQRVLTELQGVKNVIFLTTDVHATLVNDARFQTLESGGAKNSGIMDVTVGPVATANFGLEIDGTTGQQGSGCARRHRVPHAAAAGRGRDAVLGSRPVQLRRGHRHGQQAHGHAQGHRRRSRRWTARRRAVRSS